MSEIELERSLKWATYPRIPSMETTNKRIFKATKYVQEQRDRQAHWNRLTSRMSNNDNITEEEDYIVSNVIENMGIESHKKDAMVLYWFGPEHFTPRSQTYKLQNITTSSQWLQGESLSVFNVMQIRHLCRASIHEYSIAYNI